MLKNNWVVVPFFSSISCIAVSIINNYYCLLCVGLVSSSNSNQWCDEEKFEVKGLIVCTEIINNAPRESRLAKTVKVTIIYGTINKIIQPYLYYC